MPSPCALSLDYVKILASTMTGRMDSLIAFDQNREKGFFRGPGGLTRVAEIMADPNNMEGYCYGCVTYWVETGCDVDTYMSTYNEPVGRSKIRGYQKAQYLPGMTSNSAVIQLTEQLVGNKYVWISTCDLKSGLDLVNKIRDSP